MDMLYQSDARALTAMELYDHYKRGEIDLSPFGILRSEEAVHYFCTPRGAEIIGSNGVDGIHYCMIRGLEETVFVVTPMGEAPFVYPVAEDFRMFVSLLMACGSDFCFELAHAWTEERFLRELKANPPSAEAREAAAALTRQYGIHPSKEPYEWLWGLANDFDYSRIPRTEEYYDVTEEVPPPAPVWEVTYEGGLHRAGTRQGKPGTPVPVTAAFSFGGESWQVLCAYRCSRGLVLDLCAEGRAEERLDFRTIAEINGKRCPGTHCRVLYFQPWEALPFSERNEPEAELFLAHYGLPAHHAYRFYRMSFPFASSAPRQLKTVTLCFAPRPGWDAAAPICVTCAGDSATVRNPVTGERHLLSVTSSEVVREDSSAGGYILPPYHRVMEYTLTPPVEEGTFRLRDSAPGDAPRQADPTDGEAGTPYGDKTIGIIGGADGPTVVSVAAHPHKPGMAVSAGRFRVPGDITWVPLFLRPAGSDVTVSLRFL